MSYHFEDRCVWIIGACFPGSSTSPMRTGVYTRVFHSERPLAHYLHRSEKPVGEKHDNVSHFLHFTNNKMHFIYLKNN